MRLNTIKPADGSRKPGKRVGRGHSAGQGKTCGRGHKGQHVPLGRLSTRSASRAARCRCSGVCRRSASASRKARYAAEVRLHELAKVDGDVVIDLDA